MSRIGIFCLCLFLVLFGLMGLLPAINVQAIAVIRDLAAIAASVLLLIGK